MTKNENTTLYQRFLVVRTDRIGDVILSTPVLTALRRRYPTAHIAMLIKPYTYQVVQGHPHLDQILLTSSGERFLTVFFQLLKKIKSQRFDAVLLLHPTFQLALICWLARIPVRVGTRYRPYSFLFSLRIPHHRKKSGRHEVDLNLDLAAALDACPHDVRFYFHIPPEANEKINALLKPVKKPFIVIHPGSGGSALDWPIEKFALLTDRIQNELNERVLVSGTQNEKPLIDKMMDLSTTKPIRLEGQLSIKELGALLKKAKLVVANSTGPLHLAVAVGTPVIGLYCPLLPCHPNRWGPYDNRACVLMPDINKCKTCSSCDRYNCMNEITVEQVIEKFKMLIYEEIK